MHTRLIAILFVLISVIGSCAWAQSDRQLIDRYDKFYAAGKYELALQAAEEICNRYPAAATWHFNAGALCAKLNKPAEAIEHLQTSAQNNYTGVRSVEQNSDLDSIREMPEFLAVLETIRANANERMEEFKQEALVHQPKMYIPDIASSNPVPLVIALHGTGMDGQSMYDALEDACVDQQVILIAPDALRPAGRQSGSGFSWTYRDESDWFVNKLIDDAVRDHNADPDRVILVGFSQGANIALILGQTQSERFLAAIPICGHYESQNAESSTTPAPFYLISGARDPWKKTYIKAKKDFEALGAQVQTRVLAGYGHRLPSGKVGTREYVKAIKWSLQQTNGSESPVEP
jgi:predicted esterase